MIFYFYSYFSYFIYLFIIFFYLAVFVDIKGLNDI